jgi:hypothetical protein
MTFLISYAILYERVKSSMAIPSPILKGTCELAKLKIVI